MRRAVATTRRCRYRPAADLAPAEEGADSHGERGGGEGLACGRTPRSARRPRASPPSPRASAHPRWLYVLPNGDVLVAETAAPSGPRRARASSAEAMGSCMKKAGRRCRAPTASRCCATPTATACRRRARLSRRPEFALRHGAGRRRPVRRQHRRASCASRTARADADHGAGMKLDRPAGGPRNHHWTKNIIASRDGTKLYATVGSNSNVAEHGMEEEEGRAAIWEIDLRRARSASSPPACAIRTAWPGSRRPARCGRW